MVELVNHQTGWTVNCTSRRAAVYLPKAVRRLQEQPERAPCARDSSDRLFTNARFNVFHFAVEGACGVADQHLVDTQCAEVPFLGGALPNCFGVRLTRERVLTGTARLRMLRIVRRLAETGVLAAGDPGGRLQQ